MQQEDNTQKPEMLKYHFHILYMLYISLTSGFSCVLMNTIYI